MNQLVRFGLILAMICFVATLVLALTYEVTKPEIEKKYKEEESLALKAVVPEADSFNEKTVEGIDYFEAVKDSKIIGYCVKVAGQGYNGYIRLVVGIDPDGVIKGVDILEQQETPGLGAKIDETKPGETEPWFLRQFKGKSAPAIEVKKDIDAVTGATISSKAVVDAISKTVREFLQKVKK